MSITAVVAELNPLHNGHEHLIKTLKEQGETVICILSDDFTQRGEAALLSKYDRADTALNLGADLCVLMPVNWSMSCAYNFALGGMSIAKSLSFVDNIAFGSECGDIVKIKAVANALKSPEFTPLLQNELHNGTTFAAARQKALEKIIGEDANILENPNDTLAVEYITAAENIDFHPAFTAIKRVGNGHNSSTANGRFLSASEIRKSVLSGNIADIENFVPEYSFQKIVKAAEIGAIGDTLKIENAIMSYLRRLSPLDILSAPEVGEGLENRIFEAVRNTNFLSECEMNIKSKRYTLARIRRIIMSLFLGITVDSFGKEVPYIKVLGFNKTGEELIRKGNFNVPVIMRGSEYNGLDGFAADVFKTQCLAADMYGLCSEKNSNSLREFSERIIKKQ